MVSYYRARLTSTRNDGPEKMKPGNSYKGSQTRALSEKRLSAFDLEFIVLTARRTFKLDRVC